MTSPQVGARRGSRGQADTMHWWPSLPRGKRGAHPLQTPPHPWALICPGPRSRLDPAAPLLRIIGRVPQLLRKCLTQLRFRLSDPGAFRAVVSQNAS